MNGEYVKRNLHKTEELLLKASNIDNCYTQYRLSKLYLDNNGDLFDSDKGLDYLFKSASNGYKYALYQLGKYITIANMLKKISVKLFSV